MSGTGASHLYYKIKTGNPPPLLPKGMLLRDRLLIGDDEGPALARVFYRLALALLHSLLHLPPPPQLLAARWKLVGGSTALSQGLPDSGSLEASWCVIIKREDCYY
jgi:hypothetical protein